MDTQREGPARSKLDPFQLRRDDIKTEALPRQPTLAFETIKNRLVELEIWWSTARARHIFALNLSEPEWQACQTALTIGKQTRGSVGQIIKAFEALLTEQPSSEEWLKYEDIVESTRNRSGSVASITDGCTAALSGNWSAEERLSRLQAVRAMDGRTSITYTLEAHATLRNNKVPVATINTFIAACEHSSWPHLTLVWWKETLARHAFLETAVRSAQAITAHLVSQGEFERAEIDLLRPSLAQASSSTGWSHLEESVAYTINNGFDLKLMLANFAEVKGPRRKVIADTFMADKLPLHSISYFLANEPRPISSDARQAILDATPAISNLAKHYSSPQAYFDVCSSLHESITQLGWDPLRRPLLQKFLGIFNYRKLLNPESIGLVWQDLLINHYVQVILRDSNPKEISAARDAYSSISRNDHPPFPIKLASGIINPEAARFFAETVQVIRRADDTYRGFPALTVDAMTLVGKPWALAQFGRDSALSVKMINALDQNAFPGRGVLIKGLLHEQVFAADRLAQKLGLDPYHAYLTAWPWAADVFADLSATRFLFLRGMIVITGPNDPKYRIHGIHYSYVVYNEHYHNPCCDMAFGCPTEVIYDQINGCMIDLDAYHGPDARVRDVNTANLSAYHLKAECEERGLNLLNLGWGSNFGGGLCNAFPPQSEPYHAWEKKREGETKDIWGHVHKSHMFGGYLDTMTPQLEKGFAPLIEAHNLVYKFATYYQNLLDWFKFARSRWQVGETLPRAPDVDMSSFPERELHTRELDDHGSTPLSYRLLTQGYDLHQDDSMRGKDKNEFRVLCLTPLLELSAQPQMLLFDTYSLRIWDGQEWIPLPHSADTALSEAKEIWDRYVLPKIGPQHGLTWLRRDELPQGLPLPLDI